MKRKTMQIFNSDLQYIVTRKTVNCFIGNGLSTKIDTKRFSNAININNFSTLFKSTYVQKEKISYAQNQAHSLRQIGNQS